MMARGGSADVACGRRRRSIGRAGGGDAATPARGVDGRQVPQRLIGAPIWRVAQSSRARMSGEQILM